MDFNIDFNLVRSQKLLLIPQLKLALEILEMSSQELFRHIDEQMEVNPALESITDDKETSEYPGDAQDAITPDDTPATLSLKEHLLLQLKAEGLDRIRSMVGEYLIDNTDENGYLNADICEVASFFNTPAAKVGKVLEILQGFDPPGICARNLKECLLLQLRQMDEADPEAIGIVEKHLDKLAANDVQGVSDAMGIPSGETLELFNKIRSLEPRPGREFYNGESPGTLVADIIVRTMNGRTEALINDDAFPEVEISGDLSAARTGNTDDEAETFIRGNVNSAIWLIKCLEQRKNILLRIGQKIAECQKDFFDRGAGYLKPVSASYLADITDMHETVLLKALAGKYLQCRWGVFELGHFVETGEDMT